jgi:hypothetical protein
MPADDERDTDADTDDIVTDDTVTDDADRDPPRSPEELGPDDEHVRTLGDGRLLVDADGSDDAGARDGTPGGIDGTADHDDATGGLDGLDGAYALVARARTGGETGRVRVASNDVAEAFEALVRWYVGRVAADVAPEEALAVLLANSDLALDVDVDADADADEAVRPG